MGSKPTCVLRNPTFYSELSSNRLLGDGQQAENSKFCTISTIDWNNTASREMFLFYFPLSRNSLNEFHIHRSCKQLRHTVIYPRYITLIGKVAKNKREWKLTHFLPSETDCNCICIWEKLFVDPSGLWCQKRLKNI